MRRRPERLRRVQGGAVANQTHNRLAPQPQRVTYCCRHSPAQTAAAHKVVARVLLVGDKPANVSGRCNRFVDNRYARWNRLYHLVGRDHRRNRRAQPLGCQTLFLQLPLFFTFSACRFEQPLMRQFACHPALLKLRQQFLQGECDIPHHREASGVGASQLVHIRRELIHRAGFRNGLALAIQNGNQASAADDKHRIVGVNDAGDFLCGGGHIASPERVLRGEG